MDTKNIQIDLQCLVALTPEQWEHVFDSIGSKLEEMAFEYESKFAKQGRAWAKNQPTMKALSEICGQLADHFFVLRDWK